MAADGDKDKDKDKDKHYGVDGSSRCRLPSSSGSVFVLASYIDHSNSRRPSLSWCSGSLSHLGQISTPRWVVRFGASLPPYHLCHASRWLKGRVEISGFWPLLGNSIESSFSLPRASAAMGSPDVFPASHATEVKRRRNNARQSGETFYSE
ncbi:LOW QUALITY PROTEIN: hypothetical protein HID58_074345 [Brassica napus]|uniref:Uncharacterized protein n=1 Tax=Brassica napus TaxID=3708 RepID=A0ABQ7YGP9_BRANA|nr:LOW QUALITY PROTEIN: hypothetical protein HID58_074345 [Brassica napus]